MDAGDKLAAATLAASRCAALGFTGLTDYFEQYAEFRRLFQLREAVTTDTQAHLGSGEAVVGEKGSPEQLAR
jgi:hypothetical protein